MKYVKPKYDAPAFSLAQMNRIADFVNTLPDSFTVLEEVWPAECTKDLLAAAAWAVEQQCKINPRELSNALCKLSVIAPGPRKRKVYLYEKNDPLFTERVWQAVEAKKLLDGWRKVGECEIEEGKE